MNIATLVSRFDVKRCCASLAVFAIIVSTLIVLQPYEFTQAVSADIEKLSPSLPSTANLTLVALNGTTDVLNSSQIMALPSITASGGYIPEPGPPFHTNNYTGVPLNALANLVGGLNTGEVLMVEGSDGYTINFTYSQVVNGNFSTFNSTGESTLPTKPIVAIVAYYNNSQLIPANSSGGSGPLMVAIVGNNSLVTQGKYWVKWVVEVKILSTTIPEFSSVSLIPLFIALTLIAIALSVWLSHKSARGKVIAELKSVGSVGLLDDKENRSHNDSCEKSR